MLSTKQLQRRIKLRLGKSAIQVSVSTVHKHLLSGNAPGFRRQIIATHDGSGWLAVADCHSQPTWTDLGRTAEVREASGIINARVSTAPSALEGIVRSAITCSSRELRIQWSVQDLQAFAPSPPKPLYRFHGTEKDSAYEELR